MEPTMLSGWNDLVWERLMEEKQDIFISYRRNGGEWFAYCVYLELVSAGYSVFFDTLLPVYLPVNHGLLSESDATVHPE